jgi:WD40 repeat protein
MEHKVNKKLKKLVVSAAGDETLRFWKIFNPSKKKKNFESNIINFNLR